MFLRIAASPSFFTYQSIAQRFRAEITSPFTMKVPKQMKDRKPPAQPKG